MKKNSPNPDHLRQATSLLMFQELLLVQPKVFGFPHLALQPNILRALGNTQLPHPKSLPQHQLQSRSIRLESQANPLGN